MAATPAKAAANLTQEELAGYIDHSVLKPEFTRAEIERTITEGIAFGCKTVCVNPSAMAIARALCVGTRTGVSVTCDFPFGQSPLESKIWQMKYLHEVAAHTYPHDFSFPGLDKPCQAPLEIDVVANYGFIRSELWEKVMREFKAMVEACRRSGVALKVILETDALTKAQIARATELACHAGVNFVKSSTGFYTGERLDHGPGATPEVIALMLKAAKGQCKVKASGGIRTREHFLRLIDMGVDRVGVGYRSMPLLLGMDTQTGNIGTSPLSDVRKLIPTAKSMLSQIISFWRGLRDDEHGGYYGYMDFDLQVDKTADKGTILNSRILWFFSKAAVILEDSGLLEEARHAYRFLTERCLDKEHGGVYWSVRHDGAPADTTKHTYNQAFAIYALSAYYQATGDLSARSLIIDIYCLIETHCADKYGYIEAFSRDFKPVPNDKLSENGVMADKTMNTLLHLAEAYASYVEAETPQKKYSIGAVSDSLRHILDIFLQKVYNSELHRNEVFFDAEMAPLKRDGRAFDLHSYGHDIEASWLLDWAASLAAPLDLPLDDDEVSPPDLARTVRGATGALAENVYQRAFHNRSLWNECENGRPDETRVWWVQAEGVVGFVNAYQRTGDPRFFRAAEEMLEYIQTYLVDKRPGSEWFWDVDGNGAPSSGKPIVEPWKCPYHNGRMCLEILRRG